MTRLAIALASLCLLATPAWAANPLLGRWQVEPAGPKDTCADFPEMDFAPALQTIHTAASKFNAAGTMVTHVIYFVAANKIYVSSTPGFANAPMYTLIGPNEIRDNTDCKYRRM